MFCLGSLSLPARAEGTASLSLVVDGRIPEAGAYTVTFDGTAATEFTAGTFSGSVADPSGVSATVTEVSGGLSHTVSGVDLSRGCIMQLYHYAKGLKEKPAGAWSSQTGAVAGTDYSQSGTSVKIYTALGLAWLAQQGDLYGYSITLESDLDMSAYTWSGISGSVAFTGTFDGKGHTVSGLLCDETADNAGLFASVGSGGIVRNVSVSGSYFRSPIVAGAIAGQNGGTIANCWSDAVTRSGNSGNGGGIVGTGNGAATNCCFYGKCVNAPLGAAYYRAADGSWTGASDAAAAAQALEAEALAHPGYSHWQLTGGLPVYFTGTTFTASVKVTLDGTAAELASVLGTGAGLTLNNGGTALTGSGGTYTAAGITPGSYGIYNGSTQLGTAIITTAQPEVKLSFYSVTVEAGKGIASASRTDTGLNAYLAGTKVSVTATVKDSYTWGSWTVGAVEVSTDQSAGITVNGITTLTANGTPTDYSIVCNLDGGSLATANPASYNVESASITLTNPTLEGSVFLGWTGTDITGTPDKSVVIPAGSTGDRSYTAVWGSLGFTEDSGGTHTKGTAKTLTFRNPGPFDQLTRLEVDGASVPDTCAPVAAADGSTTVTLSAAFLNGLAEGRHSLTLVYGETSVTTYFTVTALPKTGDTRLLTTAAIMLAAGLLLAGLLLALRTRRTQKG